MDPDVEAHRAEITRQNKTTPVAILVVLVAAIVVALVSATGDGGDPPVTSTSTTVATARPQDSSRPATVGVAGAEAFPVLGIGSADDRTVVLSGGSDGVEVVPTPDLEPAADPAAVAVGDRIVVLDRAGAVRARRPGEPFAAVACCHRELVASNEADHVWAVREGGATADLIDLRSTVTGVELALDGEPVIGPGSFGLVTRDASRGAVWRRPDFEPTPLDVPAGRVALSSGGDVVAFAVPDAGTVEIRRLADGSVVRTFDIDPDADPRGALALLSTDGQSIAVGGDGDVRVLGIASGTDIGSLSVRATRITSVGGGRFAGINDGVLQDSVGGTLSSTARVLAIATRAE